MIATESARTCRRTVWETPDRELRLASDEIHVWRARLDGSEAVCQRAWCDLHDDERARAGRFRFDRDRRRYIVAHGILRMILGRYAGVAPRELHFQAGRHGKPALAGVPVHFNISHADGVMLCAVARQRRVGVDVERVRADVEFERVARQIFSPRELSVWAELPSEERPHTFFRSWVRKEAYVKALGAGFSWPATRVEVLGSPEEASDGRWSWQPLDPGPGYMGASVTEGEGGRLKCWEWPEKAEFAVAAC